MESKENKLNPKYAYLNQLSTERLEEMLRLNSDAEEDSADIEYIDAIEKVILRREENNPTNRLADVNAAWNEFKTQYATSEEIDPSLYDIPDDNSKLTDIDKIPSYRKPHHHRRLRFRRVISVAAVIAAVLAGMVCAQASGLDIFGALARWTNETFNYETGSNVSTPSTYNSNISAQGTSVDSEEYRNTFRKALKDCGMDENLAPSWFLTGFVPDDEIQSYKDDSYMSSVFGSFINDTSAIYSISIDKYASIDYLQSMTFEKDSGEVERYMSNYRNFYIMSNNNSYTATWSDGKSLVITIGGEISIDDIKTIIDSIGG